LPEDDAHRRLVDKIANIFRASGFDVDRRVGIRFEGNETDLDVCALYQETLIVIECKSGANLHFQNLLLEWRAKRDAIANHRITIETSSDGLLTANRLSTVRKTKLIVALSKYSPSVDQMTLAQNESIMVLDNETIEYYQRTAKSLRTWTKFEMFKEFGIRRDEERGSTVRDALKITQPGTDLFVFTLPPYRLLRMAYVYRRSRKQTYAYQRMIKSERIERISKFLSENSAFLPNGIVVAFDSDVDRRISFEPESTQRDNVGTISIPNDYCSAWIVDGQHRLFGFTNTPYSDQPPATPAPQQDFDLLVVGLRGFSPEKQAKTFVDINDNQKRIDSTLLLDLTTIIRDLDSPFAWPSLLVKQLNELEPWKHKIRIFEVEQNKPISLAGFAKYALLRELLKPRIVNGKAEYSGPLFSHAPFDYTLPFDDPGNIRAFQRQLDLLVRYFSAVKEALNASGSDKWNNQVEYGCTKTTATNASLLVLKRILERRPRANFDFAPYLNPIGNLSFRNAWIVGYGGGWQGFRRLANRMIHALNEASTPEFRLERYR